MGLCSGDFLAVGKVDVSARDLVALGIMGRYGSCDDSDELVHGRLCSSLFSSLAIVLCRRPWCGGGGGGGYSGPGSDTTIPISQCLPKHCEMSIMVVAMIVVSMAVVVVHGRHCGEDTVVTVVVTAVTMLMLVLMEVVGLRTIMIMIVAGGKMINLPV